MRRRRQPYRQARPWRDADRRELGRIAVELAVLVAMFLAIIAAGYLWDGRL